MRDYLVMFHKVLPDSSGHDRRVLQRRSVVRASSEVAAAYSAKAMFSEAAGIADWRMRADTCEVVELPSPRRGGGGDLDTSARRRFAATPDFGSHP